MMPKGGILCVGDSGRMGKCVLQGNNIGVLVCVTAGLWFCEFSSFQVYGQAIQGEQ